MRRNATPASGSPDVAAAVRAAPAVAAEAAARRAPPADGRGARFAAFVPATYDETARTVEVVLSSGAPVRRWSFTEELEISATSIDLSRVTAGQCPLLDTHNQWRIDDVLGRVMSARIEGENLIGLVSFADTEAGRKAEGMVKRGELRGISIGYRVTAWKIITVDDNDHETWRATSWELLEASLVPVPADVKAGVRSAAAAPGAPSGDPANPREDEDMRRSLTTGAGIAALAAAMAPETGGSPAAQPEQRSDPASQPAAPPSPAAEPATRAAPVSPPPAAAPPAAPALARFSPDDALAFVDQARSLGVEDRARELVTQNGRGEIGVEAARSAVLQAAAEHQRTAMSAAPTIPGGTAARAGATGNEATRQAAIDALVSRTLGTAPEGQAVEFMGLRLLELAASRAGLSPRERDPITILRAAHSTSDFPMILEAAANKILLGRYALAAPTFRSIARRRDLRDFKPTKLLTIGDFPTLKPYQEDGEIKAGTINEGREQVVLGSYGRILRLTRQAIVNDDLGAFDDVFGSIGTMIAQFENATFWAVKAQNSGGGPKLSDNINLFHASHGNLAGSGGAIDITNVGVGRAAIRKQKNIDGNTMNLAPQFLVVGPDQETAADQLVASISPAVSGQVNPFSGKLTVVTEGSIAGNAWELYADPSLGPVWSFGYLADAPGPRVLTEEPFNVDGIAFRATLDFYAGATDYRGGYRNPGQ